jgi:hypothetical protein
MKEDVNKDIECPNCQTVYKAVRADAPPPPVADSGTGRKSKLAEIGSGKKKDDEDEDERPSKRKRRRDDDDDDDDRPSKRRRNRDDDDDDDDRPSRRRSSSRRRDDDDDDDYDRPRRRSSRGGYNEMTSWEKEGRRRGERPVMVTILAILEFLGAASSIICGIAAMITGPVILAMITGATDSVLDYNSNGTSNAGFKSGATGLAALGMGAFICCGIFILLIGVLYIFGGMGLMKMRRYGQIITFIIAVVSILGALYGGFQSMGYRGSMVYGGGGSLFQLAFGAFAIFVMIKYNDEFE